MTHKHDGGPAFPVWELNGSGKAEMTDFGMSLLDYFAAKALPMCMTADGSAIKVAEMAYSMADAMLAQREKHACVREALGD